MSTKVFINMAVKDLPKSMAFFQALGYRFNKQFTDETAASLIISDTIYAMLLTEDKFQGFIPKKLGNAKEATETIIALSCESRREVDDIVNKAIAAGATTFNEPQDYGFMYYRAFQDLDGHLWEYLWMDPAAVQPE